MQRPGFVFALILGSPLFAGEMPKPTADFQPDPATVRRYGPAYRYPQDGWIVVHIEGSPYERGYQHGNLISKEIADYADALAKSRSTTDPAAAWSETRTLVNALFLRKYDPEYLEEMKGIADGAASAGAKIHGRAVDLIDIAAVNSELETSCLGGALEALPTGLEDKSFAEPKFPREKPAQADHCSAFVATGPATADGKIVFGHITMFGLYEVRHFNIWLDIKPEKGHRVLMQTFAGGIHSGMDYYQNDAGLLLTETTIGQTKFGENATPLASRIRKVIQYANSIDDAVAFLKDGNNGLYTNEWLLGDINTNEIAMFELGTHATKLWRSSRDEWFGGTQGFYWGCNNTKDLEVRLETVASTNAKPANLTFRPSDRDRKWVAMYQTHKGKIGPDFAFEAFTSAPLAAYSSCDAKFTTAAMAKDLQSYAIFGPPLGKTWEPNDGERAHFSDIKPLVSNDWTILKADAPAPASSDQKESVDLTAKDDGVTAPSPEDRLIQPAVWHGTIRPAADRDTWLAAAFSDYEKWVALERAMRADGKLSDPESARLSLLQFRAREKYRAAVRRLGAETPPLAYKLDVAQADSYDIAANKGVLFLAALRGLVGPTAFDALMNEFGHEHAGKPATSDEFEAAIARAHGKPVRDLFAAWLEKPGLPSLDGPEWSIQSFTRDPSATIIVYGATREANAQREAALRLQNEIARRWYNYQIPVKADVELTDAELKSNHLLLIGRPATNTVTAKLAGAIPASFGAASFQVEGKRYGHPQSTIVVAGPNPESAGRYSAVVFAGLSADSTRSAVARLFASGVADAPACLMPAGSQPRPVLLRAETNAERVANKD
jgi:hypothetical protein